MKTIYSLALLLVLLFLSAGCISQATGGNQTGNQSETTITGSWVQAGESQNILIQFQENGTALMRFRSNAGSTNDSFIDRIGYWEQTGTSDQVNLSYLGPTSNESRTLILAFSNETAQVKKVYNGTQETTSASGSSGPDLSFRRAEWPSQEIGYSLDNPLKK